MFRSIDAHKVSLTSKNAEFLCHKVACIERFTSDLTDSVILRKQSLENMIDSLPFNIYIILLEQYYYAKNNLYHFSKFSNIQYILIDELAFLFQSIKLTHYIDGKIEAEVGGVRSIVVEVMNKMFLNRTKDYFLYDFYVKPHNTALEYAENGWYLYTSDQSTPNLIDQDNVKQKDKEFLDFLFSEQEWHIDVSLFSLSELNVNETIFELSYICHAIYLYVSNDSKELVVIGQ